MVLQVDFGDPICLHTYDAFLRREGHEEPERRERWSKQQEKEKKNKTDVGIFFPSFF